MRLLLFVLGMLSLMGGQSQFYSLGELKELASSWGSAALGVVVEAADLRGACPYVVNMSESLRTNLPSVIKGQPRAIEAISDAVGSWEYQRRLGHSGPLVLAMAGDTGTGKSETALRVAELLLGKRDIFSSNPLAPKGLLVVRGEEYSNSTFAGREGPAAVQRKVIGRIASYVQSCGGNGIILLDEIQKFVDGSIELFLSALGDKLGDLETTHWLTGQPIRVSTRNLIVLLVTDVGRDQIRNLLLSYQGLVETIPHSVIRTTITKQFDRHWRNNLFSSVVTENVAFFPLGRAVLIQILKRQLYEMGLSELQKGAVADFVYDSDLLNYLTQPKFIHYQTYALADNSASIVVAEKGGRSIVRKGPLLTLQAQIVRHMQPWHLDKILHIGIEPSVTQDGKSNMEKLRILGLKTTDLKEAAWIYFQWCHVTPAKEAGFDFRKDRHDAKNLEPMHNTECDNDFQTNSDVCSRTDRASDGAPGDGSEALVAEGSINIRIGLLYHLVDSDIFSPRICETKWIGQLEASGGRQRN